MVGEATRSSKQECSVREKKAMQEMERITMVTHTPSLSLACSYTLSLFPSSTTTMVLMSLLSLINC